MSASEQTPLRIGIVVGSTRPGRRSATVARWVHEHATARGDAQVELVDLADYALPVLDEAQPAIYGTYEHEHTRAWSQAIAALDAYVFVTPEYNRSIPGALKNALDYLYGEWNDKPAGFVSYGLDAAGTRAVEQLRVVMGELQVADVRAQVALSLFDDFDGETVAPRPHALVQLGAMLDQLLAWGAALKGVREPAAVA